MEKRIKLVLCDIDGTLITSGNPLPIRTKTAIDKIHKRGIWFGLASGRALDELHKNAKNWGFEYEFDCLIGVNGSQLYDGIHNQSYHFFDMKKEWIKEILEFMRPFHLNPYIYNSVSTVYLYEDENSLRAKARGIRKVTIANGDESLLCSLDVPKLLFRMSEEQMKEIEPYAIEHCKKEYKAVKTQKTMLEFVNANSSKGYALDYFCKQNNLPLAEVMAFGDASNDNELLQNCGLGICMQNGTEDTKAVADIVSDLTCDEEGVADFLEKYFLL